MTGNILDSIADDCCNHCGNDACDIITCLCLWANEHDVNVEDETAFAESLRKKGFM